MLPDVIHMFNYISSSFLYRYCVAAPTSLLPVHRSEAQEHFLSWLYPRAHDPSRFHGLSKRQLALEVPSKEI